MLASILFLALSTVGPDRSVQRTILAPKPVALPYRIWPSDPPSDCPFPSSTDILGIGLTERHKEYQNADTWYPSWAADGNLYSPWTDGRVNDSDSASFGSEARTGYATIVGDDPLNLTVVNQGTVRASPAPYGGRYPCGSLVYNGTWFYGTYCLMNERGSNEPVVKVGSLDVNWGVLGPFVGFRISTDSGKTWTETAHTPSNPLFPEPARKGGLVRIGSPHFVDFGRNMEHSPDGKAYLVAHGAAFPDPKPRIANASWITGDCVYLLRVPPRADCIDDRQSYEYFAGRDARGRDTWTRDFAKIKPIADWNNRCGCVTMTYDAPLRRYLMCVTDGVTTMSAFNTFILESDRITGPWKLVSFMKRFGPQGYFVNIPSKFIGRDGRTVWLCYAANFADGDPPDPPGSRYGMCLRRLRLMSPTDPRPAGELGGIDNVARRARAIVSSTYKGYSAVGLTDEIVDGFPGDIRREWASDGETDTATVRLSWDEPQTVDRVWLFDRPNLLDQITSGMLIFSDGSTIMTGALPDDAKHGLEVRFKARRIKWLIFAVTGVKPGSPNIGLSEIGVFRTPERPGLRHGNFHGRSHPAASTRPGPRPGSA